MAVAGAAQAIRVSERPVPGKPSGSMRPRAALRTEIKVSGKQTFAKARPQSWTHSLRQRDKWQLRSLQARISLERKESHDEEIPPQSFCGI